MIKMTHKLRPIVTAPGIPLVPGTRYAKCKRGVDILLALFLLALFGPLFLLIVLAIRICSRGPILHRQERIGKGGQPFTMLKFRTMRVDNDEQPHRQHMQCLIQENLRPGDNGSKSLKLGDDSRVTDFGRILRTHSLDELPQLINVLRGEMSVVGPRPPLPYEYEVFKDWHKQRQAVLPGITGLWQVIARNQISFDEMVRLDLFYINQMGLWTDLDIILRTPPAMIRGKGAG